MGHRVIQIRFGILITLLIASIFITALPDALKAAPAPFSITFLDVGQGDAVLIETPDGIDVLIDGGPNGRVLAELAAVLGAFDRTIDMVVATHPDADHIGGLIDVLARYDVGTILLSENEHDTTVYESFENAVAEEDAALVYARAGQVFTLGAGTTVTVLFPADDPSSLPANEASIVLKVSYGETDILLTGDAPASVERTLVERYGEMLQSEILKLGHHGSRTSSDAAFIHAVDPLHSVVSAGSDNRYGHPHEEVIDRVLAHGSHIYETHEGRVTFVTHGTEIELR